jgi:hypothetical protein
MNLKVDIVGLPLAYPRTRLPPNLFMRLDLYIYSTTTDLAAMLAIAMNSLLDAVTGALQSANGQLNQTSADWWIIAASRAPSKRTRAPWALKRWRSSRS